jgi:hypothetical protein
MPAWLTEGRGVAAVVIAVALAFVAGSFAMPIGTLLAPGPGLVPLFLGSVTLVAMIASLLMPEADAATVNEAAEPEAQERGLPRVPVILGVLALCLLGFESIGYVPMLFMSSLALLYFLERQSLVLSLVVSLILSAGLFFLFERVLYVTLPRGLLELVL